MATFITLKLAAIVMAKKASPCASDVQYDLFLESCYHSEGEKNKAILLFRGTQLKQ